MVSGTWVVALQAGLSACTFVEIVCYEIIVFRFKRSVFRSSMMTKVYRSWIMARVLFSLPVDSKSGL